jgi:thioredoxin-related protein
MKKCFIITTVLAIVFYSSNTQAQTNDAKTDKKINWMSFEEAVAKADKNPKKMFIDVYTEWCGWCKKMDANTFTDSTIIELMNKDFYAVKLDAETRDTIRFRDKQFVYMPEYKANQIALDLLKGKMGYPNFVVLDEQFAIISAFPGYKTVPETKDLLNYLSTNTFQVKSLEDFVRDGK